MEDSADGQQHFASSLGSCSLVSVISLRPSDLSKLANCLPKTFHTGTFAQAVPEPGMPGTQVDASSPGPET